jgi:hypothetical protein
MATGTARGRVGARRGSDIAANLTGHAACRGRSERARPALKRRLLYGTVVAAVDATPAAPAGSAAAATPAARAGCARAAARAHANPLAIHTWVHDGRGLAARGAVAGAEVDAPIPGGAGRAVAGVRGRVGAWVAIFLVDVAPELPELPLDPASSVVGPSDPAECVDVDAEHPAAAANADSSARRRADRP